MTPQLLALAIGSLGLTIFTLRFMVGAYSCPGCGTRNGEHDPGCHFS